MNALPCPYKVPLKRTNQVRLNYCAKHEWKPMAIKYRNPGALYDYKCSKCGSIYSVSEEGVYYTKEAK